MRSVFKSSLISLALTLAARRGCQLPIAAAARSDDPPDEKSRAMAERIRRKVGEHDTSSSWNAILRALEDPFRAAGDAPDREDGGEGAREARGRALRWLALEDESPSVLGEDEYDRGLLHRYALATVYFATGGDDWIRCSRKGRRDSAESACESDDERWLSPSHHTKWEGINGRDGRVAWLDLSGRGLRSDSFLPPEVTLLSPTLELLWASENEMLAGTLPNYWYQFQSLVSLSFYGTSLSGTIPESIYALPKLNSIRLYKSKFEGTISPQIEKLKELKWLWIHDNQFTGIVPKEIGKLDKLEGVTLHGNRFAPVENDGVETNNIVPEPLCGLKGKHLKHLWSDCEEGALTPASSGEKGGEGGAAKLAVKEGVRACSCCTRCFPQKKEVVAVVN